MHCHLTDVAGQQWVPCATYGSMHLCIPRNRRDACSFFFFNAIVFSSDCEAWTALEPSSRIAADSAARLKKAMAERDEKLKVCGIAIDSERPVHKKRLFWA